MMQSFYYDTNRPWYKDIVFGSPMAILTFLLAIIDMLVFNYQYIGLIAGFLFVIASYLPAICIKTQCQSKMVTSTSMYSFYWRYCHGAGIPPCSSVHIANHLLY